MVGAQRDGGKKLLLPSSSLPPSLLLSSQQPGFTLWNSDRKNLFESSCYFHMATFVIRVLVFAPNKFLDFFPVCKMASVLCAGKGESSPFCKSWNKKGHFTNWGRKIERNRRTDRAFVEIESKEGEAKWTFLSFLQLSYRAPIAERWVISTSPLSGLLEAFPRSPDQFVVKQEESLGASGSFIGWKSESP